MGSAPDELQELKEHAEHALEHGLAPVSFTMAALAVFLAIVTLLGHRAHTEEVLLQNKITDQWNFYQAKNIRRSGYEILLDELSVLNPSNQQAATGLREKYQKSIERYRDDQKEIEAEARKLEQELGIERRRANRFDLGEAFLEVALVVTSITLLTRRRLFWGFGGILAALGIIVAITSSFVR